MSFEATRWARRSRGLTPTQKLVLLILADSADNLGNCWNGALSIAEETGLSDRAVRTALHDLVHAEAIVGIMGRGRRPSWRLAVNEIGTVFLPKRNGVPTKKRKHVPANRNLFLKRTETGSAGLETGADKQSMNNHRTTSKPSTRERARGSPATGPLAMAEPLPDWLPAELWEAWSAHRLAKDRKGWTPGAMKLCLGKLAKFREQGQDPRDVIEQSIAGGWTGLFEVKAGYGRGGGRRVDNAGVVAAMDWQAGDGEG